MARNTKIGDTVTEAEFSRHCEENKVTDRKLDQLMWLAEPEMQTAMKEMIENQRAAAIVGKRVFKFVGYVSAVLGLAYLIFKFWKDIK